MLLKALHCDQNELQNSELAYARFFVVSIRSRKLYFLYNFSIFSSKASSLRSINVQGFTVNNDENSIYVSKLSILANVLRVKGGRFSFIRVF